MTAATDVAGSSVASEPSVLVQIDGPIAEIVLNRPSQRNALNTDVLDRMLAALQQTAEDDEVKVVLVRSNGSAFCAGNDLKERAGMTVDELIAQRLQRHHVFHTLEQHPKPCIAVVQGPAVAAGCEIALSCDFVFAGEEATFRYPEAVRGSGGGTARLPGIVGKALAKELLFTGRLVPAAEALQMRMVNRVLPNADLLAAAREMAQTISRGRSFAMTQTKRAIDQGQAATADPAAARRIEQEAIAAAVAFQVASGTAALPTRADDPA